MVCQSRVVASLEADQQALDDQGQHQVALVRGLGVDQSGELQAADGFEDHLEMAMAAEGDSYLLYACFLPLKQSRELLVSRREDTLATGDSIFRGGRTRDKGDVTLDVRSHSGDRIPSVAVADEDGRCCTRRRMVRVWTPVEPSAGIVKNGP